MKKISIETIPSIPTKKLSKLILDGKLDHLQNVKFTFEQIDNLTSGPIEYLIQKGIASTSKV